MSEEPLDDFWPLLTALEVCAYLVDHLAQVPRPTTANRVGLNVMVEQLDQVQIGAAAGQEMRLDPLGVFGTRFLDELGAMRGMSVHDQVDLAFGVMVDQAFEESMNTN